MSNVNATFDGKKTVTVPSVEGLLFRIDGREVEAGDHEIAGSVQVSTRPVPGYVLGESVLKEQYFVVKTEEKSSESEVKAADDNDSKSKVDDVVAGKDAEPVETNTPSGNTSPGTVRPSNLSGSTPRP